MSAAIFCPAVCDVINKAAIYDTFVCCVFESTFFCSSLVKSDPTWQRPEELKLEGKNVLRLLRKHLYFGARM